MRPRGPGEADVEPVAVPRTCVEHAVQMRRGPLGSAVEAVLDVFDARLQRGHLPLQLSQIALQDLAPTALVGQPRLDSAQGLGDGLLFLLQPLESSIDLVEVPEDILAQLGKNAVDLGEPAVHLREPVAHLGEPAVHLGEPAVHLRELTAQELDELLVLRRSHGQCLLQRESPFKCVAPWTPRAVHPRCR